ncbi:MAG: hypothetical protein MJ064_07920 [Lachnospiraceae bacterium]|nr:hypothetical protein [Lachnospiraceae bacterium]
MKKIVASCCVLIVALIAFAGIGAYREAHRDVEDTGWPGEKGVRILREKDPTDIIWYGKRYAYPNRYPFEFNVPVRYENDWDENTLRIREGFNRAIIVVSDREGDYDISSEDLETCVLMAMKNERCFFLYLGHARVGEILEILKKNTDYFTDKSAIGSDVCGSFGVYKRSDGNIQFIYDPVIGRDAPEEDGWIWEYFAGCASDGTFDGSFQEKIESMNR